MKKNEICFYKDYLKKRETKNSLILISKFCKSYLIGPKINKYFDENSFYHRIISNSIYSIKKYKKCRFKKIAKYVDLYYNSLNNNEVIEINEFGDTYIHRIINLPGEKL